MLAKYERILVAHDGSPMSDLAFREGVEIAKRNNATLILIRVIDTRIDPFAPYIIEGAFEEQIEAAEKELQKLVASAAEANFANIEAKVKQGQPRDVIANQVPKNEDIDMIVIGATGKNRLEKLWLGSTTNYVVNHAKCNVLVIRENK